MGAEWSTTTGVYRDLPEGEYHADRVAVSNSWLSHFRTPRHLRYYLDHKHDTPATILGRALHCLTLEPERFKAEYQVMPDMPRRSKQDKRDWADWAISVTAAEAHAALDAYGDGEGLAKDADALIMAHSLVNWYTPDQLARINAMHAELMGHSGARWILENAEREVTVVWRDDDEFRAYVRDQQQRLRLEQNEEMLATGQWRDELDDTTLVSPTGTGLMCRARLDLVLAEQRSLCDLKSTSDASHGSFGRDCANFRYYVQDPFYSDGAAVNGIQSDEFSFLITESDPPHCVALRMIDPFARDAGRRQYIRDLEAIAECMERDEWPGYPDEPEDQYLPGWFYAQQRG